jgi:hypothetical protein
MVGSAVRDILLQKIKVLVLWVLFSRGSRLGYKTENNIVKLKPILLDLPRLLVQQVL